MVRIPKHVVVDFETEGIESRPHYPPVPIGVSIQWPGKKPKYYAWGHATENNCTKAQGQEALAQVWESGIPILGHNLKFDVEVAEVHMGMPRLGWQMYHDTLFLLFLDDPRAANFQLKPSAERILFMPPEERDAVWEWFKSHQPVAGVRITEGGKNSYMGYLKYAPGSVVGPYANGDVERTDLLFKHTYARVAERNMLRAYDRERRLMPILMNMEQRGVRVHLERLFHDIEVYRQHLQDIDHWLRKKLRVGESVNLESGDQLVTALIDAGLADHTMLGVTKTGKYQTTQEAFERAIIDKQLLHTLHYKTQLGTCLGTFMEPWLNTALQSGGYIYTSWNSVRTPRGGADKSVGTRTGRLSSTPNFQNVPNEFKPLFDRDQKGLPKVPLRHWFPLPFVRSYIAPSSPEHVLVARDFSQQELRILAHYEDDLLRDAYLSEPWLDMHDHAREMINSMLNKNFERKPIKNTGFGIIYGMGVGKLALKSEITVELAQQVKTAYLACFPGLKAIYADMRQRARDNLPVRTWGDREYYVEDPIIVNGEIRTFDYKLLNLVIQGSAADCTKEAMIAYHEGGVDENDWEMLLTVHDEIVTSVPREDIHHGMHWLQCCMDNIKFDVPMLSEGYYSYEDWFHKIDYDKKGKEVHTLG